MAVPKKIKTLFHCLGVNRDLDFFEMDIKATRYSIAETVFFGQMGKAGFDCRVYSITVYGSVPRQKVDYSGGAK